jgi:hypothetical protein
MFLEFSLNDSSNTPDTLSEDGGVAEGTNVKDKVPFPKTIDTTGGTKVQGALKGIPGPSNSSESKRDSDEDQEDEDTHRLRQIAHAARLGQPITVEVRGQCQFSNREEEVIFQREFASASPPAHILGTR